MRIEFRLGRLPSKRHDIYHDQWSPTPGENPFFPRPSGETCMQADFFPRKNGENWGKTLRSPRQNLVKLSDILVLPLISTFGSTYLCETAFSKAAIAMSKYRNSLNLIPVLSVCLTTTEPDWNYLYGTLQPQKSH